MNLFKLLYSFTSFLSIDISFVRLVLVCFESILSPFALFSPCMLSIGTYTRLPASLQICETVPQFQTFPFHFFGLTWPSFLSGPKVSLGECQSRLFKRPEHIGFDVGRWITPSSPQPTVSRRSLPPANPLPAVWPRPLLSGSVDASSLTAETTSDFVR